MTPNFSEHAAKKVTPRAGKHRQYNGGAAAGGETAAIRGGEAAGLVQVSGGYVPPSRFVFRLLKSSIACVRNCYGLLSIHHASGDTVEAAALSLAMCVRCTLPFAHALALTSPDLFSVRNMREVKAFRRSSRERVFTFLGEKQDSVWNCASSFLTAALPRSANLRNPAFKLYWF